MGTIHMCISVRGVLRWPKRQLRGLFVDENGRKTSADESRELLLDHLSQGHEVLPMGVECEGFDYKRGCPGHDATPTASKVPE